MLKYFNRKIAYKIILRLIIVLGLFILCTITVLSSLTNGRIIRELYAAAAFVCIVEAIWVFFNLRFEIVSRFVLTVLIGLSLILYDHVYLEVYTIIFEIILSISIIYYIKEHKYENITLNNLEDIILKIDYQFYILILLISLCIAYPTYIYTYENPFEPNHGKVTFNEASSQINNTTDVMVTVDSVNESDYIIVKEATEDHMVYTYWTDSRPNQVDYAPDFSSDSIFASNHYKSATLISAGDNAIIQNLEKGDIVHVYSASNGIEDLVREYKVR